MHGRQLLQTASLQLVITVRDPAQTPEQLQAATKVLIQAIGGPTVESLPANATLDDLVTTLNTLISNSSTPDSTAQQLLGTMNDAIASANLTDTFNNATVAPTGMCCQCLCLTATLDRQGMHVYVGRGSKH
jgi:hypothetical protein